MAKRPKTTKTKAPIFAEGDLIFDIDDYPYTVRDGIAVALLHSNIRFALETELQRNGFTHDPRPRVYDRRVDRSRFQIVAEKKRFYYLPIGPNGVPDEKARKGPFKSTGKAYAAAAGAE